MTLVAIVTGGCDRRARPNVLVVTIATLRADRLGCYGFGLAHTPAIDRLAAEGVRCSDAFTASPITLPAHASILTGLYPPAHGVRDNGNYALAPEASTLAERLRDDGYRTGAFVSAAVLARRYGVDQGFDTYDDDLWAEDEPPLFMIRERPAARTVDRALAWLDDGDGRPFFLWVHLFDPHQPYTSADADIATLAPTAYDAEIAMADRAVGRLVDRLREAGRLDETLVVLTADHGESLGEHGEPTHGIFIYDATTHVPMIFRFPRAFAAGRTYPGPIRHIDVMPTILAVLGLVPAAPMQGTVMTAALRGEIAPPPLSQYAEARLAEEGFGMAPLFGVRDRGRKWIQAPRPELYDLRTDPRELHNLLPGAAADAEPLEATLDAVIADSGRRALTPITRTMDRETEEMLRALGYLAPPEERAAMAGLDPKDGMAVYNKLQEARQLAQLSEWERADRLLDEVLAVTPNNVTARNVQALAAVRRGDLAAAEAAYDASLAYDPRQHRVLGALGALALRRDDLDGAQRRFDAALGLAPTYVEAMSNLGFIAAARGDDAGAEAWYRRAIALDPGYPHVHRRLADLFYDRRDYARALEFYRRVLSAVPGHFEVLIQAGNAARFLADDAGARAAYAKAGALRPDSWIPPYNLACLDALRGDVVAALASLDRAVERGLAMPDLLDDNDDFASLRATPEWAALVARVQAAAIMRPARS